MTWEERAIQLRASKMSWPEIGKAIQAEFFPAENVYLVAERARGCFRRYEARGGLVEYQKTPEPISDDTPLLKPPTTVEYKGDGSIVSDKLIEIMEGATITPEYILKAHGLDPGLWKVLSYKNNYWHSQAAGGNRMIMYQSKLLAKPLSEGVSFAHLDEYFANLKLNERKKPLQPIQYDPDGEVLEICLPDLHGGLLAWRMETGDDYDLHIATDRFFTCLYDIVDRCAGKRFSQIYFVTLGDLMHIDNDMQTTTKGTFQQADGRTAKIFDCVLDMLIDGLSILETIAPVELVYLCGNHDRVLGYTLIKALQMAFRSDNSITFDVIPDPQKFRVIGVTLVGWTHGDISKINMRGWLQQRARSEFGLTKRAEIHAGHFHTDKVVEIPQTTDAEGIVVRYLPTICSASYWEHQQAYPDGTKAVISFVWSLDRGLRDQWYSVI